MTLSRKLAHLIINKNVSIDALVSQLRAYNLLPLLPHILQDVKHMSEVGATYETVCIETPFEADTQAIAHIKRLVGNDIAPYSLTINKKLLAGFKARFKGTLYDGSAERIMKEFTH